LYKSNAHVALFNITIFPLAWKQCCPLLNKV
jgi:hypothetical protein